MKMLLSIILILYSLYSITSCIKVSQPCSKNYAFAFPVSVTPQDTFSVGDTIWWEMNIPNELFDSTSAEYIDLTNFELFFQMSIGKLEHNVPSINYTTSFRFTAEVGSVVEQINSFNSVHFLTHSVQDKRFKIACIPTEVGTYDAGISFPNLYGSGEDLRGEELQIVDPDCKEFLTRKSKITINNGEINYHMMEGVCRYLSNGNQYCYGPQSELPMHSVYAFHVKEP